VKLDLYKGYWQVPVRVEHVPKTAFSTPDGHYQFRRMPFGLCNAPAAFQRMMDQVLGPLKWKECLVFMDDLLIFAQAFEELLGRLGRVFAVLGKAGLKLQARKCEFGMTATTYLGHHISAKGVAPDPMKVEAIASFPTPTGVRSVRRFLGMAGYYRHFIPQFARVAAPLTDLLRKNSEWKWGREHGRAFESLVGRLRSIPVLVHLDPTLPLVLYVDASLDGLGAVLAQKSGPTESPIYFLSRRLKEEETRWHSNDLECLAVVWALKKLRHYLYGRDVVVRTDSTVARALSRKKELTGKQGRWVEVMAEFEPGLRFEHCSGRRNVVADALSRAQDSSGNLGCDRDGLDSACTNGAPLAAAAVSACQGRLSADEVELRQERDPELGPIVAGLREASSQSRLREAGFELQGGLLVRRNNGSGRRWLLVVPKSLRFDVTRACHEEPTSGHEGQKKTLWRVQERFWWRGVSSYVRKFVSSCLFCQLRKTPKRRPEGFLEPIPTPTSPFRCWGIDHSGPHAVTPSGNVHILVAIDYMSKFVVAEAVPDTGAEETLRFMLDKIVYTFGVPDQLISDQGPAFTSELWAAAMIELGIHHSLASAEHAQTNGLVEKMNGTLMDRLAAFVDVEEADWDARLPQAVFAINSSCQTTTRASPFEVLFGIPPVLPIEARLPKVIERSEGERKSRQVEMRKRVEERIAKAQKVQKENYDRRRRAAPDYHEGDLVLVRRLALKRGVPRKFQMKYAGPYEVFRRVSPTTYQVADLKHKRTGDFFLYIFSTCVPVEAVEAAMRRRRRRGIGRIGGQPELGGRLR
jgi:RNase H-like domain found in reverse transcriptase/Reverse transcriptase (RNA-dependent DNA polymerase)/Integrase zinc binding domain/Integrase core domain